MNLPVVTDEWRAAIAAVDAALDSHEAALMAGDGDALPALARELQGAVHRLARTAQPRSAHATLHRLAARTHAQQGIAARRSAQVAGALDVLAGAHDATAARGLQATYASGGGMAASPFRSRGFERA